MPSGSPCKEKVADIFKPQFLHIFTQLKLIEQLRFKGSNLALDILKRLFPSRSIRRSSNLLLPSTRIRLSYPGMDLNPFRLCSGLKFLGYFMIFLVFSIIALSYYAVVVLTWVPHLLDGGANSFLSFTIIAVFHLLLVLLTWSYFMVVLRDPGVVPANWKMSSEQTEGNSMICYDSRALADSTTMPSSSDDIERRPEIGYCSRCQNSKPPRCHHCSVCQRCVLKMDHHCIWVVNCVGACNYKFFLLFVLYTFLETTMDTLVLLPNFINFFKHASHRFTSPGQLAVTFLAFVLNLAFALSLLCFVIMHASLLLSNTTSVEVYEKKRAVRWKYDLGWKTNFEQVFGTRKLFWFFPLFAKEDLEKMPALHGLDFPTCSDIEA